MRRREAGARISRWIEAVERVPRRAFTGVGRGAGIPAEVHAESLYWCDEVFQPDANPHDARGARHGAHRRTRSTPDLLRHAYTAAGLRLTVTEGRNFLLVEVDRRSLDVLALPSFLRAPVIQGVAGRLFRAAPRGGAPSFHLPAEIDEGVRFCTCDRAEPLLLAGWHERLEGGIRGGRLYFLCYKKAAQRVGFAGDERWFEDAARRAVAVRRRRAR